MYEFICFCVEKWEDINISMVIIICCASASEIIEYGQEDQSYLMPHSTLHEMPTI